MEKILCIDIGNTHAKWAIVDENQIQNLGIIEDLTEEKIIHLLDKENLKTCALCNVGAALSWENALSNKIHLIRINQESKLPFLNAYTSTATLGFDRICMLAAAIEKFPEENVLAISLGSCITYNLLLKDRVFRGGAISPGMRMRFKSMHDHTANLPLLQPKNLLSILGYDTDSSMQSGVEYGILSEIEGMANQFEEQFGKINVILTGGDTSFFESKIKSKIFVDYNLIFKGIYAIAKKNF